MEPVTIKLFLVNGSPKGLRIAELSNWSGIAVASPRSEIRNFLQRNELSTQGIYFLVGEDSKTGDKTIYVGEAESVKNRLKQHLKKDFWTDVFVFTSKDENLTKSHVRYLEKKFIELFTSLSEFSLENSANTGAKLPESDAAEMDAFYERCIHLMPVLSITNFDSSSTASIEEEELLFCTIKGLMAKGKRTSNGFLVYQDSEAVKEHRPSARNLKKIREDLLTKGILKDEDSKLVFTQDMLFKSPSTAAGVIRGGNSNGLAEWKNSEGISLKNIEESY